MPSNYKPYLALTEFIPLGGVFPPRSGNTAGHQAGTLSALDDGINDSQSYFGAIRIFAGNFYPYGDTGASGQLLNISQNTALFSLYGTTYGGDGKTTFALPNLGGHVAVGNGQGYGLAERVLGEEYGSTTIAVTQQNLPFSSGGTSSYSGEANDQPSLTLHYMISAEGIYPTQAGDVSGGINNSSLELIGTIAQFGGNFTPLGYLACDGQLVSIADYEVLFNLIGTTYGGDGVTTFALPDLRGRAIIGAGNGYNGNYALGQVNGTDGTAITQSQMPTNMGGSGAPISNQQPTLALNYMIALEGIFPSRNADTSGDSSESYLGEIVATAIGYAPKGWAFCYGQILSIYQNQALFSLLGTTYGGNGVTTFALPDLRGRVVMGTDATHTIGEVGGTNTYTLTSADIPALNFSGDNNANALYGGDASDTISGLNGNDTITGNGGADGLNGGDGNDNLIGGSGNDTLSGNLGDDTMTGGTGDDLYYYNSTLDVMVENPGEGIDTVRSSVNLTLGANFENLILLGSGNFTGNGNALDNALTGNTGNNTMNGGAGNDTIDGGAGDDTMSGGTGDDLYSVDSSLDVVNENDGEGTDTVRSTATFTLGANIENLILLGSAAINGTGNNLANVITGNSGANNLNGGDGNDSISGGAGNDTISGGNGDDTAAGGLGDDLYYVYSGTDVVMENAGEGIDTVRATVSFTLGANFENLILLGTANSGTGNDLNNSLTGNSADNNLNGGNGNDSIDGGLGADNMSGGTGNDTFVVDNVGDVIVELSGGGGTDLVKSSITYALLANVENLTLTGSANIDGSGNTAANILTGNTGNNALDGKAGADNMAGGLGDDTYTVDNAGDSVTENSGEGTDTVRSGITYTLGYNLENLILTGAANLDGTGNSLNNTITGNDGTNQLNGYDGNDYIDGGLGADTMVGGTGNDTFVVDNIGDTITELSGSGGTDLVLSSVTYAIVPNIEKLTLTGLGNINGTGNSGSNTLIGNAGDNTLDGRAGSDILTGGLGADVFLFLGGSGTDTITDFTAAQNDMINVNAYTHGVVSAGMVAQSGANVIVTLSAGNVITINNALQADVLSHMIW